MHFEYLSYIRFKKLLFVLFLFPLLFNKGALNKLNANILFTKDSKKKITDRPVQFIENKGQFIDMNGQAVPFVFFKTEGSGVDMFLTETGLTYLFVSKEEEEEKLENKIENEKSGFKWTRIDLTLKNATIKKENIVAENKSSFFYQYFLNKSTAEAVNAHLYKKITVKNIYPGIDWVLYNTSNKGFKYDFVVHPQADPEQIELVYTSKEKLQLNRDGNIEIKTELGTLHENAPYCYQKENEIKSYFKNVFQLKNEKGGHDTHLKFSLGKYNTNEALTIDPQLWWATFMGADYTDGPTSVDCDKAGNVFVSGYSESVNFPTHNPNNGEYFIGTNPSNKFFIFVSKFSNKGSMLWSTYYGGEGDLTNNSYGFTSLKIDLFGNIFITGFANTINYPFPVLNPGGGAYFQGSTGGGKDACLLKFSNSGVLLWATFFGGSLDDGGYSICLDPIGNLFVAGLTNSTNIPLLNPGGGSYFQSTTASMFISKFTNSGALLWSTYFGGNIGETPYAICCDPQGNVYLTGETYSTNLPIVNSGGGAYSQTIGGQCDLYVLKFNNSGVLKWSTYYGGTSWETGLSICSDENSNVFIYGETYSTDFPVFDPGNGAFFQNIGGGPKTDVFILKFDSLGVRKWATYYTGNSWEIAFSLDNIAIDNCSNIYISFSTESTDLITQQDCFGGYYKSFLTGQNDDFIAKFSNTGNLLWATYFGGDGIDARVPIAIDNEGSLFVSGEWASITNDASYPTIDPGGGAYFDNTFAQADDGFLAKFIAPDLNVATSSGAQGCVCSGFASATATGHTCSSFGYAWYDSNWNKVGNTQSIASLCPGNYQVIAQDTISCGRRDTTFLTIGGGTSNLSITSSQTNIACDLQCIGTASVNPSGGFPPYTYAWSTNQSIQNINSLCNGIYSVSVSDGICTQTTSVSITQPSIPLATISGINRICVGENSFLSATGGNSYLWNTGVTTSILAISPTTNTIYSVTVTNNDGCVDTAMWAIITNTLPIVNIVGDLSICIGESISLTASGSNSYLWNNGSTNSFITDIPTINTTYSVVATNSSGCSTIALQTVTINALPAVTIYGNSNICAGQNSILSATSLNSSFIWDNGNTTSTLSISPIANTIYTVTAVNSSGCSSFDTISVDVTNYPISSIADTSICFDNSLTVIAGSADSYLWNTGATTNAITISPSSTSVYSLTLSNNNCSIINVFTVTVNPLPIISLSPDTVILDGNTVMLSASGGIQYTWAPSTGLSCSNCPNPTVTTNNSITYTVEAIDINGCKDYKSITVYIDNTMKCNDIYVPTAFSPNNDWQNDKLFIYGNCIKSFSLTIFDRWGEKVFESVDINQYWDGKFDSQDLTTAIFTYQLKAELINGNLIHKTGTISLIR